MYSSSYSRAKFGMEAREPLHKPKEKSCSYYLRIIFFFSSLIQSLIIVSLVLFLIYGQPEQSAEEKRVKELELGFNRLSENNIQLRKEKGEMGAKLGASTAEKAALEKEMAKLKADTNTTEYELKAKLTDCEKRSATTLSMITRQKPSPPLPPIMVPSSSEVKTLQSLNAQQKAMITLIEANFTQTVQYLSQEREIALRERDTHHQDAITLRRENAMMKEQLIAYTRKCKEDFAHSLDGIKTVTRDFLNRINNLFPHQLTFHLTCDSQQEQMEKIRNSCTNLSRDVENKFQLYLDKVGDKVASIQALSSRMEVQNTHLNSDLQQCERRRGEAAAEAARQLEHKQKSHDDKMERLLIDQNWLREQKKLLEDKLSLKEEELQNLQRTFPSQPKPAVPQVAGMQASTQQDRQARWPLERALGIGKTPTVR